MNQQQTPVLRELVVLCWDGLCSPEQAVAVVTHTEVRGVCVGFQWGSGGGAQFSQVQGGPGDAPEASQPGAERRVSSWAQGQARVRLETRWTDSWGLPWALAPGWEQESQYGVFHAGLHG